MRKTDLFTPLDMSPVDILGVAVRVESESRSWFTLSIGITHDFIASITLRVMPMIYFVLRNLCEHHNL